MNTNNVTTEATIFFKHFDNDTYRVLRQDFGSALPRDSLTVGCAKKNSTADIEIDRVVFNRPATIVWFTDGTKVVSKCGKHEVWDYEKGIMACMLKKVRGNKYLDVIKKHEPLHTAEQSFHKEMKLITDGMDKLCEGLTLDDNGKVVPDLDYRWEDTD